MPSSSSLALIDEVGQADRRTRFQRTGGNRISLLTRGALSQGGPVACCTAQFLGTASKKTKITNDLEHDAEQHTEAAEEMLRHNADQGGRDQLAR